MSTADNQYDPFWRNKTRTARTWLTTGNTDVVTDGAIGGNSYIIPIVFGTVPASGRWAVSVKTGGGGFTVTSSDSENAGLTYHYIVL